MRIVFVKKYDDEKEISNINRILKRITIREEENRTILILPYIAGSKIECKKYLMLAKKVSKLLYDKSIIEDITE